jgi:imidazolonepropionase-like amidohydrolase
MTTSPAPPTASVTLFQGGDVFAAGGTFERRDVLVEGDRIGEMASPGGPVTETIDCTGLTVLPGFIDCHVHVMTSSLNVVKRLDTPLSYRFFEAAQNLQATLHAGVTTVRDAAGADSGIKRALQDGLIEGPRLQTAVAMVSQTGGHGDRTTASGTWVPSMPEYPGMPSTIADGPEEIRRVVRTLIREGADVIKVATSGGVMSPRSNPRHGHLRAAELAVLVEEARAAGIPTMAHAQSADGIKEAVRAGIDSIEHGVFLDEEAIELMCEHGTFLVPTLVSGPGVLRARDVISAESVRKVEFGVAAHMNSIKAAVKAGVRIAMGTDSGVTPHGENLDELPLLAEAGMTPVQVLQSATSEAAELLGMDAEVGTVEVGKKADLVIVEGDPLDLATIPERIRLVVLDGKIVRRNE